MATTEYMWKKLMNVMDTVTTHEQSEGAFKYATLWFNNMQDRMTVADVDLWFTLIEDLSERFPQR